MAAKKNEEVNMNSVKAILDAEEKVMLHLFKDSERYSDDLVVGINGYLYQIKRGEDVMVPKSVYELVMNSMKQDEITSQTLAAFSAKTKDPELL